MSVLRPLCLYLSCPVLQKVLIMCPRKLVQTGFTAWAALPPGFSLWVCSPMAGVPGELEGRMFCCFLLCQVGGCVEWEWMKKWDLCDHLSIEAVGAENTNFMELHYNRPLVFKGNGFLETSEDHNPDARVAYTKVSCLCTMCARLLHSSTTPPCLESVPCSADAMCGCCYTELPRDNDKKKPCAHWI